MLNLPFCASCSAMGGMVFGLIRSLMPIALRFELNSMVYNYPPMNKYSSTRFIVRQDQQKDVGMYSVGKTNVTYSLSQNGKDVIAFVKPNAGGCLQRSPVSYRQVHSWSLNGR